MREDIVIFDVRNILREIRESVEEFFFKNKGFFDLKVIFNSYVINFFFMLYNILFVKM